jgi:hypothetical protein
VRIVGLNEIIHSKKADIFLSRLILCRILNFLNTIKFFLV